MERINIFGGTFNPAHVGHRAIARAVTEDFAEKLIIMPAGMPPHKDFVAAPPHIRMEMCELTAKGLAGAEVSDMELNGEKNYTFITAEKFLLKNIRPCFVIGGDSLSDLPKWKKPEWLMANASFLVFPRAGREIEAEKLAAEFNSRYNGDIQVSEKNIPDVSSTEIRILKMFGLSCRELLLPEVEELIDKCGLYKDHADIVSYLKRNLTEKRYIHTANVTVTAMKLNEQLGLPAEKVILAAMLHDAAKKTDVKTAFEWGFRAPDEDFNKYKNVRHQAIGAYVAEKRFGISDEDILNAVAYHTTGRPGMSALEKLIYTADCIEPGRTYDGAEKLRKTAFEDFESGFINCLCSTYRTEMEKSGEMAAKTIEAVEYYCPGELKRRTSDT